MALPARRKPLRSGIARAPERSFPSHRQWTRGHSCCVPGCEERDIEAAHYDGPVPMEDMGGTGIKRHDKWCLPACSAHHREMHAHGWRAFERKHGVDLKRVAEGLARISPHRHRWMEEGR